MVGIYALTPSGMVRVQDGVLSFPGPPSPAWVALTRLRDDRVLTVTEVEGRFHVSAGGDGQLLSPGHCLNPQPAASRALADLRRELSCDKDLVEGDIWACALGQYEEAFALVATEMRGVPGWLSLWAEPESGSLNAEPRGHAALAVRAQKRALMQCPEQERSALFDPGNEDRRARAGGSHIADTALACGVETEEAPLARARRLPLHRRPRFRFGAMFLVTCLTLAGLCGVWTQQLGARGKCMSVAEAGARATQTLQARGEALAAADFEALAKVVSPGMFASDTSNLAEIGSVEAPTYEVRALDVACEGKRVEILADVLVFRPGQPASKECADTKGCAPRGEHTLSLVFSRNPWLLESLASPNPGR